MTTSSSAYFASVAGQWDELRRGYFGPEVREAAIAKAYLRPEMAAADIGAGTGFISEALAPLVRRVYAVDASAEMLETARRNLAAFTNIEYHHAEGERLPFPDESLDAVFANMYLHHTADPLAAIREMARVLRPGGRLVITDMDAHEHAWLKEEMADVWLGFPRGQVRAWFEEAGLVNVVVDCTGQSCCAAPAEAERDEARISVFVASATRRIPRRSEVRRDYAAAAEGKPLCGCAPAQESAASGCCGAGASDEGSCCGGSKYGAIQFDKGYSAAELAAAPQEAAEIALGCGNPLALAGLRPGEVVLDIGSGGGLDAFLAAQAVGERGRVIGVDMTPEMLQRARQAAERGGFTNVEFRQGYAEALPAAEGEADVVISNCVINLAEDKGLVFREAYRVLKPDGRLEVSDMVTSGPLPFELVMDEEGWSECITGALPEREYLDLAAQAGFGGMRVRRSASMGEIAGVAVYSVILSARKE